MKKGIQLFLLFTTILLLSQQFVFANPPGDAKYVWADKSGDGRHQFVYFRYELNLEQIPEKAELNLYASSRYLLKVNGVNINWGPARNYPEEPEYDSHDLVPFLKKGKNAIAVRVMANNMNTYQLVKNIGGFIAWGKIGEHDLSTPGNWICRKATGYDQTAPKIDFAQGTMDVYDARKGISNWDEPEISPDGWKTPELLNNQDAWGTLSPRSIPFLTQLETLPRNILGAYNLKNDEEVYSFRIKIPDSNKEEMAKNPWVFAYTYIYSPKDQVVDMGLWWGEHFLNGEGPLKGKPVEEGRYRRSDVTLDLKKGWNNFFVKYGIVWAHWDFHILVPKGQGLQLSPEKDPGSEYFMMTAGPFSDKEDKQAKKLELPFAPDELPDYSKTWEGQKRGHFANNPAIEIAYSYFDEKIDIHPSKVTDFELDGESAVVFDMGQNTYGRIFVEYSAPEGTLVDVGWAEDHFNHRIYLLKRYAQYMAFRNISKGGYNYFEMSRPNGHRFIHLNVKNNNGKIKIHKIGTIKQNFPMEDIGRFECSDRMLTAVWELGKRTIELCADDVYTDPFRERGLYAGDLLPETTIGYAVSGDTKLIRKSMQQIQGLYAKQLHPNPGEFSERDRHNINVLGDFPFITLINLWWYYRISGDLEFLKTSYPKYKYMMDYTMEQRDERGIFSQRHAFIEWTQIERDAQLACMQALIAESYETISKMALEIGEKADAEKFSQVAGESRNALQKYFWDNDRQAYFDGFKDGQKIENYYPVSNAWSVLFDEAGNDRLDAINEFLAVELDSIGSIARKNKTTPYGGFYILGALYRLQNAETAEMFMRKYWTNMILDGDDTAWENFAKQNGQGSLSHGWSGGPTWYMSTYLLGVQLGFPEPTDLSRVTIAPQAETVSWAKGVVPHPTGPVKVDWKVQGDNLFLNYEATKGVEVVVNPIGSLAKKKLWVNGKLVKNK